MPTLSFAQSKKERKALVALQKADQQVISNLKNHIQYLSSLKTTAKTSDSGSEVKATQYIAEQFKLAGLHPKGTNGFIQSFSVDEGKKIEPSTYLKINEVLLDVNKQYFPLAFSAEKKVAGMPAMALRERGVPWFIDLKDLLEDSSPTQNNIEDFIKKETVKIASKGATALFVYNSGSVADGLVFNSKDESPQLSIPVIYITSEGYKKYFNDHSSMLDIELNVAFKENNITGKNVAGSIDNGAPSTIVIGAYYNHEDGTAKEKTTDGDADNNSSGIATLIELARMLSVSKAKNNNYLFIAFGGNDKGLTASNYWLSNTTTSGPINYMFNFDLTGFNNKKTVLLQGYNSSMVWREVLTSIQDKKLQVSIDSITAVTDLPASFIRKEIPVLSFFSASPGNYLKEPVAGDKMNSANELEIAKLADRLVEATNLKGKVAFSPITQQPAPAIKTAETNLSQSGISNIHSVAGLSPKTTVSLGIIPDRTNSDKGFKIIGVSPKKIASKLGLQPGDILTYLGVYKISDFKSYLQALTNFKPGDKTTLQIKRGKDDKEFALEF